MCYQDILIFLRFVTANQTASCVYQCGVDYQTAHERAHTHAAAAALRGRVDISIYTAADRNKVFRLILTSMIHTLVVKAGRERCVNRNKKRAAFLH